MIKLSDVKSLATDEYEALDYGILSIERKTVVLEFAGALTEMYAISEFVVFDCFGNHVWDGDARSVADFVNGFNSGGITA